MTRDRALSGWRRVLAALPILAMAAISPVAALAFFDDVLVCACVIQFQVIVFYIG